MRGFFACLLLLGAGLGACAEQAPVEQAPDPWKREWSYERIDDAIRGSAIITAKIGSNEAFEGGSPYAELTIRTAAGGNEIWLTEAGLGSCWSGQLLVKIGEDPVDEVPCQPSADEEIHLDPDMIPRIQRANKVVVEVYRGSDGIPQQVTFGTSNLRL